MHSSTARQIEPPLPRRKKPKQQRKEPFEPPELAGLALRTRELRERLGWAMSDVDRVGQLSNGRTGRVERKDRLDRFSAKEAVRLAKALGVSLDYLLTGKQSPGTPLSGLRGFPDSYLAAVRSPRSENVPAWAWEAVRSMVIPGIEATTPELLEACARMLANNLPAPESR